MHEGYAVHALQRVRMMRAEMIVEECASSPKLLHRFRWFAQITKRSAQCQPKPRFDERFISEALIDKRHGGFDRLSQRDVMTQASFLPLGTSGCQYFRLDEIEHRLRL